MRNIRKQLRDGNELTNICYLLYLQPEPQQCHLRACYRLSPTIVDGGGAFIQLP